ncbi:MAG: hypothetical protein HZA79_04930 [Sphingobacteriales bacterium]|nr:hypothetical protein [Sphingobacteriales bacterium]
MPAGLSYSRLLSPAFLLLMSVSGTTPASAQELTIYAIPSPKGINWQSPGKLVRSYLSNFFAASRYGKHKHAIGHVIVELRDSTRHVLTSVTSASHSGMTKNVLRRGYGLGILFSDIRGILEETDINLPQVQQRSQSGEIAFIRYRVSQPVFDRLWQYYEEYKQREYYRNYNGANKPREGLGAGCSAFAVSFLEVGGLLDILPDSLWKVEVNAPAKLVGGHHSIYHYVQAVKIFLARHWLPAADPSGWRYSNYEPSRIYQWIRNTCTQESIAGPFQVSRMGRAPGLLVDCRDRMPPAESIWKTRPD